MKVLISGAGIGGLSTALCLVHHGINVAVMERADRLDDIGAGIQLPPNAMRVFAALGLDAALAARAFRPMALEARMGRSGRQLFTIALGEAAHPRWGAPYLHIHRADYIAVLAAALRAKAPNALHLGAALTGYAQTENKVQAHLSDGRSLTGDALIGADGLHSLVQAQMLGTQKADFTGQMAWRATVPMPLLEKKLKAQAPRPTACVWMGQGRHCVTYQLRGGALANFVGVVETPSHHVDAGAAEAWSIRGTPAQARADFKGWHPTLTGLLGEADRLYRWALFDRQPLTRWVDGRVALLGDAAHPMLPFMAQGAAMAVEDGWVLATNLANSLMTSPESARAIEHALTTYQHQRYARTVRVQAGSRANAKTFHRRAGLAQIGTYGPMWLADKIAPALIGRSQNWLYGHDVTRAPLRQ
jgi:salicylate hydroxylase